MVDKIFGDSGNQVVIEEFLEGQEFSVHAFCDGKNFKLLPTAQDHKAVDNGDQGPNTGGMGTVAPLTWVTEELMQQVSSTIIKPALEGLAKLGSPFVGLLYPGLMMTKDGPKVIEFNARFGDPETQSLMRLLKTDLLDILEASVDGKLNDINIEWENKFVCCIVLTSGGYPAKYEKGLPISGVEEAAKLDDVIIFHAGTLLRDSNRVDTGRTNSTITAGEKTYDVHQTQLVSIPLLSKEGLGEVITNGGRVLGVTAVADNLQSALNKAYAAVKLIHFEGMHYRKDIGAKSLQ
jgi:phosphoribosylamine---glycine ligase